jgi:uncharacterized protein YjiS (DUF1127 family)
MSTHWISADTDAVLSAQISRLPTRGLIGTIREWQWRVRSRRELAALTNLDLKDLGYPADVKAEIHKPFWRS